MKRSSWIRGAIAVTIIGPSGGCNRSAPTEPGRGFVPIEKAAVSPASAGLAGTWSGTITFPPNDPDGDEFTDPPCEGPHPITTTLVENGDSLTGQFQSCAGMLEIHGVIVETAISGNLRSATGQSYGRIMGTVSSNRIQFRTILKTPDLDDPEGNDDDEETLILTQVDLQRSLQRTHPVVVDSARAPRLLPTRR